LAQTRGASPRQPAAFGEAPRLVTTGGNESLVESVLSVSELGVDSDTGEAVRMFSDGSRVHVVRHLAPSPVARPGVAFIDALAFSLVPPDGHSPRWLLTEMDRFAVIDEVEDRGGYRGFACSVVFGGGAGLMAWGGESQRGRVYFSIQGKGCGLVFDWVGLASWLQEHAAVIKRVDVAYDDLEGEVVSIAWALEEYESGGFSSLGRPPRHAVFGDWLAGDRSKHGRTLGIGCRANGKYCRIYEKGKQLGEPGSSWVRVEVEWRGKDRLIPFDVLVRPGIYLAGAYPCLAALDIEQSRIKTIANAASTEYDAAVAHAKRQIGRLLNVMMEVCKGDAKGFTR
jgi:phage replication initiation protein